MLLLGCNLRLAFVLTGTLMMILVGLGFVILCWELTHSPAATVLAFVLLFLNGGLGFLYALDGVGRDPSAFREIFTGFYKTPTNQPDLNLRWVNVVCDMMVPQRTLLTGWMALMPALWLLVTAAKARDRRLFVLLGVWAGAMPMVHTHSFLALGLISAGAMAFCVWQAPRSERLAAFLPFALYGGIAVLLALPQLLTWSVPQTVKGGALHFRFNWVNNNGHGGLIDGYCWFWIKNVGLIWLMMVPAALCGRRNGALSDRQYRFRMLGLGALVVYVVAELIQFQPNEYDNNKLFYAAYIAMLPAVGWYLVTLWNRLKGVRGRAVLAAAFLLASTLSGALTVGREVVSNYQLFTEAEVQAADFVEKETPADAVFLTGVQHKNPVAALAGRSIVCGTPSYLYFHGIDYSEQYMAAKQMLELPEDSAELFEAYGVSYAYISGYERNDYDLNEAWFAENCELAFAAGDVCVYKLPPVHGNSTEN